MIQKLANKYQLKTNQKLVVDNDGTIFPKYQITQYNKEMRETYESC